MKIGEYEQMMAYLTRPGFKDGTEKIVEPPKSMQMDTTTSNPIPDYDINDFKNDAELYILALNNNTLPKDDIAFKLNSFAQKGVDAGTFSMQDAGVMVRRLIGEVKDRAQKQRLRDVVPEGIGTVDREDFKKAGFAKATTAKQLKETVPNYLDEETFVKLRKQKKDLTNAKFAEFLNEEGYKPDPRQAEKFGEVSVDRRYNAAKAKGLFPKNFVYKGSAADKAVTPKERKEYLKYVKKNFPKKFEAISKLSEDEIKSRILDRRSYLNKLKKPGFKEAKNEKNRRYTFETRTGLRGEEAQRIFYEKAAQRKREINKDANTFYRNVRDGKTLLWEDLLKRTTLVKNPPFKLNKKIIKGKKYTKDETQKFVLTDKNGNKFRFDSLREDLAKAGQDPQKVFRPYEQKAFLYKENLMKPIVESSNKVLGARDNPIHVHHVEGFSKNPFNTQLTFADQNLREGNARQTLTATFNNILQEEKAKTGGDTAGILNFNRKKKALNKFYDSLGPDIAAQLGKQEVGTRTPLVDMLKKKNIKMSPEVKQRAMSLGAMGDIPMAKEILKKDFEKLKSIFGSKAARQIAQTSLRGAGSYMPVETLFMGDMQQRGLSSKEMALDIGTLGLGTIFKDIKEKFDYVKSKGLGDELQSAFRKQTINQQARPVLGGAEGMFREQTLTPDEQAALNIYNLDAQNIIDMRRSYQADEYRKTDEAFGLDDPILRTGAMNGGIMRSNFSVGGIASLFRKAAQVSDALRKVKNATFEMFNNVRMFGDQKGIEKNLQGFTNIPDKNRKISSLEDIQTLKANVPEKYHQDLDIMMKSIEQNNFETAWKEYQKFEKDLDPSLKFENIPEEYFPMIDPLNDSFVITGPRESFKAPRYSFRTSMELDPKTKKPTGKYQREKLEIFDPETGTFREEGKVVGVTTEKGKEGLN